MRWSIERKIGWGFILTLAALLITGVVSYRNTRKLVRDSNAVAHSHEVLDELDMTLSMMKDVESGQRGYVITGDDEYLVPYRQAAASIQQHIEHLKELLKGESAQEQRLVRLEQGIKDRLELSEEIIRRRRVSGFEETEGLVSTGRDKLLMNGIRKTIAEMSDEENKTLAARRNESNASARNTIITLTLLGLLLLALLPSGYLVIRRDIRQRRLAEESLRESEERSNYLIEHADEIIYRTDAGGRILFINPAGSKLLQLSGEKIVGQNYLSLIKPEFRQTAEKFYTNQFLNRIPNTYLEIPVIGKDGTEIWVGQNTQLVIKQNQIVGFQAVARDITERRHALEELQSLSLTDDLTGLYNRRGFLTLAEQQLKQIHRNNEQAVLVFADLDGLKQINDRFGHNEGSNAIIRAAQILKETFRESDILARLGGDEFTALATVSLNDKAGAIRSRLQQKLRSFNARRELPYELSMSIGFAQLDPRSELPIEELIRKADAAMYRSKKKKAESRKVEGKKEDELVR